MNGNHYVLVDADIKKRQFVMFDSLQTAKWDRMKVLKNVQQMIQDAINAWNITTFYLKHQVITWELVEEPKNVPQ